MDYPTAPNTYSNCPRHLKGLILKTMSAWESRVARETNPASGWGLSHRIWCTRVAVVPLTARNPGMSEPSWITVVASN